MLDRPSIKYEVVEETEAGSAQMNLGTERDMSALA